MSNGSVKVSSDIPRYSRAERVTHWLVALTFLFLAATGLAFFHPVFWPLTYLTGGGVWSRILHPYVGILMFAAFGAMALRYWPDNVIKPYDRAWGKRLGDVLNNRDDGLPEIDKYNLGQKQLFWTLVITMVLLLATGIVMWRDLAAFPIPLIRIAAVVHAAAAVVLIVGIIVHVYSAIFWVRGSMQAMTRGTVSEGWAKHHHPLWYRRVTRQTGRRPA